MKNVFKIGRQILQRTRSFLIHTLLDNQKVAPHINIVHKTAVTKQQFLAVLDFSNFGFFILIYNNNKGYVCVIEKNNEYLLNIE